MLTYLNRLRGLDKAKTWLKSQTARRVLCALPFGLLTGFVSLSSGPILAAIVGTLVTAATFGAFTDGHGNQMDLSKSDEANEPPNLWDKVFGKEGFKAEFLGLTASGLLVAIPTCVAFAYLGHYVAAISFLMFPGMGKALMYWLAQKIDFKLPALWAEGSDEVGRNPDGGEVLWGAYLDLGILYTIVLFLLGIYS